MRKRFSTCNKLPFDLNCIPSLSMLNEDRPRFYKFAGFHIAFYPLPQTNFGQYWQLCLRFLVDRLLLMVYQLFPSYPTFCPPWFFSNNGFNFSTFYQGLSRKREIGLSFSSLLWGNKGQIQAKIVFNILKNFLPLVKHRDFEMSTLTAICKWAFCSYL